MRVEPIGSYQVSSLDTILAITNTLNTVARVHKIDVDDMVTKARLAGDNGEDYQQRVVRLADRLDRLGGAL